MLRKGQKKLKGQPEIYEEVKGQVNLSLTKTGIQGIDRLADAMGLSRSEFVEQIGRRLICVLSLENKVAIKKALQQLIVEAQDELVGLNLFEVKKAGSECAIGIQQQIDQWQQLLTKLE